jgi:lipid-A-disaccharide synthase
MVIAGEASGDAHAGRMLAELKQLAPHIEISGIGGQTMRDAGAEIFTDFSELAVMGLVEVLKRYRKIKTIFNEVVKRLKQERPDLLIVVDYPGFNLKLAKKAKQLGIPVLYYISPKVWAWRKGRIKTIKQVVSHMAVLFPFEKVMYDEAGIVATCVGHPLVDAVNSTQTQEQAKRQFGLSSEHKVIGLFPGSRRNEIDALLPVMIHSAEALVEKYPGLQVVLPMAPGLNQAHLKQYIDQSVLSIRLVEGDFYDLTRACDAIVAASGTVTLEIALLGVPHFITYRVAPMTYRILKRLVQIPFVGLCNIVTGKPVVLELLQDDVTKERLANELELRLFESKSKADAEQVRQEVLNALGPAGGAHNAAKLVLSFLES